MRCRYFSVLLTAALALGACSDDTTPVTKDAAAETSQDAGADTGVDLQGDSATDALAPDTVAPDTVAPDGPTPDVAADVSITPDTLAPDTMAPDTMAPDTMAPDTMAPDTMAPDTGPPAKPIVLFSTNTAADRFTFATVANDGTGYQLVSGLAADLELCNLGIAGIGGPTAVRTDVPRKIRMGTRGLVRLPGSLGRLYRFYDGTNYSLLLIKPDGKITQLLASGADTSSCSSTYLVGVSKDGTVGALVLGDTQISLVRFDGTNWPSTTSPLKDVTPNISGITSIYYSSLTIGASELLFVVVDGSGRKLFRAPLDGSAIATQVTLPMVDGVAAEIQTPLTVSANGMVFAALGRGSASSKEDVIVIKNGVATNISQIADNLHSVGTAFLDSLSPRVALSGSGTYVAYAATSGATNSSKAWVAKTDGTGATELSTTAHFVRSPTSASVDNFGSFHFIGDDELLFVAGTSGTKADLYRYKVSTGVLSNLTQSGTTTAAPWGGGTLEFDGGWQNPAGTRLFYVAGTLDMNIISVATATFVKTDITTGLSLNSESELDRIIRGHHTTGNVWFHGSKSGAAVARDAVYTFNQNTGTTALEIATISGTAAMAMEDLDVSPDGTKTLFVIPQSGNVNLVFWVGTTAGSMQNITSMPFDGPTIWATDSATAVYAHPNTSSGPPSASSKDLFSEPISGGTPKLLHSPKTYVHVFAAGH